MKVLVNLDDDFVVEHLLSDQCKVMQGKPCGFSEHVMRRVVEALKDQRTVTHTFHPIEFAGDKCECGQNIRSDIHTRIPSQKELDGWRSK